MNVKEEDKPYGYHMTTITKGEVGEVSKVQEELDELKDALTQQNKIMALVELSDVYGAMQAFLEKQFPDITMDDLKEMSNATKRAFRHGHR